MQSYTLNRPDGALLCRVLEQHTNDAAGAILRLAWMAGLMRDEIQHLTWAQVDLLGEQLLLPDRAVPLAPELAAWLEALRQERNGSSERVVLSDRDQQPLAAQSISRLARAALDAGDLKAVRLIDLRHDYVLRQLERHDWQYVSRITGLEAAAMNVHFAAYLTEKKVSTRIRRKAAPQIDEFALWKLLQAEQDTPAGAALWLTWQLGLQVEEIASLRWDQVDLQKERLILPDRQVRLTSGVLSILQKLRKAAPPEAEWVLMSPRSRRPYERTRLSKLVRAALVQGGLDYAKYLDQLGQFNTDRNFAFNQYLSDFDILQNQLASLQGQDSVDYNRWMDKVGLYEQKQAEETDLARAQVDAILAAGGSPSADLVGASGYRSEYVQALEEAYRRQAAQQVRSGSSGGGRNSGGGGAQDYNGLFAAAMESGHPKSYIANNYKKFGFTSNSGLYDDYTEWEIAQEEAESGGVTVSQSNLPDYETILNNSSAGAYGPAYGMVLRNVQNMARNSTEEEITGYLLNQLEAGNINEEGIDTILQALNLAG